MKYKHYLQIYKKYDARKPIDFTGFPRFYKKNNKKSEIFLKKCLHYPWYHDNILLVVERAANK